MVQGHHAFDPPHGGLPPIRTLETLILTDVTVEEDDATPSPDLNNRINACFKAHRRTTRILLKHARNQRRLKYGKALLRMFLKKPRVALQSILRTAAEKENIQPLPMDDSILRDDSSGLLLVVPAEVIAQVQKIETQAISPNPTPPRGAPFPWHLRVPPNHKHTTPMISGCIPSVVMQEALRRTPNPKAAGPNGVPGMILKHMPSEFDEALQVLDRKSVV